MWDELTEVKAVDGTKHIISSKSIWTDLEVIAYAGLVWRYPVMIMARYKIN